MNHTVGVYFFSRISYHDNETKKEKKLQQCENKIWTSKQGVNYPLTGRNIQHLLKIATDIHD